MTTRALILAPFDERQLERLTAEMSVTHESWLDTLKLTDPDDLAARIRTEGISILVVEADFVFEETFADAPDLRFVGICRASTTQVDVTPRPHTVSWSSTRPAETPAPSPSTLWA